MNSHSQIKVNQARATNKNKNKKQNTNQKPKLKTHKVPLKFQSRSQSQSQAQAQSSGIFRQNNVNVSLPFVSKYANGDARQEIRESNGVGVGSWNWSRRGEDAKMIKITT